MKAYKHLVDYALKAGHKISVWDGEEWQVSKSTLEPKIIEAIESVEEAQLRIIDNEGKEIGWALVIPFGLEDEETVADMTITPFMVKWDELYFDRPFEL
jgi:hypothetical protein